MLFTKVFIYHKKIITIKILSNYNNIMLILQIYSIAFILTNIFLQRARRL